MKLPNPQRAVIDMNKLLGYCLNFNHADGQHKARVFQSALGLTIDNAEELRLALLQAIQERDAVVDKNNQYGQKYVVDFPMVRGNFTSDYCFFLQSNWTLPVLIQNACCY